MIEDLVESARQAGLRIKTRAKDQFNLGVKQSGLRLADKVGSFFYHQLNGLKNVGGMN